MVFLVSILFVSSLNGQEPDHKLVYLPPLEVSRNSACPDCQAIPLPTASLLSVSGLGAASFMSSALALADAQAAPEQEGSKAQAQVEPEKIVAGPKNIKEKTAVYFFLGWLWVAIGVLIYILRLKIQEADRLHALKFFTPDRK